MVYPILEVAGIGAESPQGSASPHLAELLRGTIAALPTPLLVTCLQRETLVVANPACEGLWSTEAIGSLANLERAMRQAAADGDLVSRLWQQRRELDPDESGVIAYLLLQDGRQLLWKTLPLPQKIDGASLELHLFEAAAPVPAQSAQRETDSLFRLSFEKAAVGMTLISSDLRILRANGSFCEMLGFREAELLGRSIASLVEDEQATNEEWRQLTADQETFHLERTFRRWDGHSVWVYLSVSVVRDSRGQPIYFIAMAEDITARRREDEEQARITQELMALASTDALTGLYNHRSMQELLENRVLQARKSGQVLSVLMLDLDFFRQWNGRYGHDAGDRALRTVAESMRQSLRGHDLACRYGGEEFVMILSGAHFEAALQAAERVRRRLKDAPPIVPGAGPVTCSVGVASYPAHASTAQSLLKAADMALLQAKRSGKDRVCGFRPDLFQGPCDSVDLLSSGLQGASPEAVNALVTAIDLRDRYTGAHCQRVGRVAVTIAEHLGCSPEELEILRTGASLLDVGKIGLPDELLVKPDHLSPAEWELMRQHPVWGEQLLRRSALPEGVQQLVRWHHERLDGSGYPDGLSGDALPRVVRIVNVVDVAVALRGDRPHRRAWPRARVQQHLRDLAGTQLDPVVVEAYCHLFPAD